MRVLFPFKEIEDENLGAMYLASMLRLQGHTTELVKAEYKVVKSKLQDNIPTLLAYSTPSFYADYYLELNQQIKNDCNTFSIFGGHHPTGCPDIIEREGVDAVCIGEGEYPLVELVEHLDNGEDITRVKNLWIKINGEIYRNPLRSLIGNLDILPFPDRSLFTQKSPFFYNRITVMTSRGCDYSCPYCHNRATDLLYKDVARKYRRRSVDNVIKEIKQAQEKIAVEFVLFVDDIFILLPDWLKEFSVKYRKEVNIPFSCYVRINLITQEIVHYLTRAGCHTVLFGIETGDDGLRKDILRRDMTSQEIIKKAKLLKSNGIRLIGTNIIGIPGGSLSSDLKTLKLNIQCQVDYAKVGLLAAYPGTNVGSDSGVSEGNYAKFADFHPPASIGLLNKLVVSASGHFKRKLSFLRVGEPAVKEDRQRRDTANLGKLFPIIVGFPFLYFIVAFLLKLARNRFFTYANFYWEIYSCYFRLYPARFSSCLKGLLKNRLLISKQ
ncbi:MAG: radical SAM protein [Candidatus Omnitrophota bacterium]